jgi:hypothetical protein
MNRWGVLVLAAACVSGAAACDDDSSPAAPSNAPLVFTATMTATQEVPAVTGAEVTATGTATVTITPTRDASNAITGGTATMQFTVTGLQSTSNIILAHVHTGVAGVAGSPIINTGLSASTPIPTPAGSASFERTGITVDATTINAIVANPAGHYFNVHTTANPGGVTRGQLVAR